MQMIPTDSFQVSPTKAIPQNFHHCFILSSIHSFRKKLLNISSIPDTLLRHWFYTDKHKERYWFTLFYRAFSILYVCMWVCIFNLKLWKNFWRKWKGSMRGLRDMLNLDWRPEQDLWAFVLLNLKVSLC